MHRQENPTGHMFSPIPNAQKKEKSHLFRFSVFLQTHRQKKNRFLFLLQILGSFCAFLPLLIPRSFWSYWKENDGKMWWDQNYGSSHAVREKGELLDQHRFSFCRTIESSLSLSSSAFQRMPRLRGTSSILRGNLNSSHSWMAFFKYVIFPYPLNNFYSQWYLTYGQRRKGQKSIRIIHPPTAINDSWRRALLFPKRTKKTWILKGWRHAKKGDLQKR